MKRRPSRCPSGKVRYRDELAAMMALASTQRSTSGRREERRHYRCPMCKGWHLTKGIEAMKVTVTWLRFDDVECVRCRRFAGEEGETVYVVDGEGCVCVDCITQPERLCAQEWP